MEKTEKTVKRLPPWARRKLPPASRLHEMKSVLRSRGLHTVCESARCPNIGECFTKPTATFMILGDQCTRACSFCSIDTGRRPAPPDPAEPANIALTAKELALKHVVITSVTRDDLVDGGSAQFALTIKAIKDNIPGISVEVLTPDFNGDADALRLVFDAGPDIFNHNLETVERLYPVVRPEAIYKRSLDVLRASSGAGIFTKSGIMVGLGETADEVRTALVDLKTAGCDAVTIGQYLRPTRENLEVVEYVEPEQFALYERYGLEAGLKHVYSGPFVRSSYNAEMFAKTGIGGVQGGNKKQ